MTTSKMYGIGQSNRRGRLNDDKQTVWYGNGQSKREED